MVLGRLEPEASPHWSQASSLFAEEIVVVYHERTKHHYHRFAWIGLRSQIRSVATRERRWFAFRDGASTSILAALRRRQHGASPAFDLLRLAVLPLRPLADRVETFRRYRSAAREAISGCARVSAQKPVAGRAS